MNHKLLKGFFANAGLLNNNFLSYLLQKNCTTFKFSTFGKNGGSDTLLPAPASPKIAASTSLAGTWGSRYKSVVANKNSFFVLFFF